MATHFHTLTIKDIRQETPECVSIAFDIPAGMQDTFRFTQGQNITIKKTIDGEELRRSYSICSCPLDNELRVAVKKIDNGKFSSHANLHLKKGDQIEVLPPTGRFYTELNSTNHKRYTGFAAGSGITPLLSIIKTTLRTEPDSEFTLVYGNRNRASIIFREELEALKNKYMGRFRLVHILSREKTDVPLNYGRINAEKCAELAGKVLDIDSSDEFFVCGPEEMIFSVKDFLETQGVDKKKIHFELFTTPGQKKTTGDRQPSPEKTGPTSKITIKLDGVAFDFDLAFNSDSILDAALQQGADLPYACKGGVCCTCRAKLVEGEVEMDANYALEPDEVKAGYILTCQSHPRSSKVVVDYDIK
ncbi:MAG TPA: 1,2-phenylacetyl-CoA epoxidase subunit PaaE [Chitinophagaceae bacterium]|nr:1,2-phenylacetyl-CoA epoxidase subunit PaaE [Chitinophagaceae bacterium]